MDRSPKLPYQRHPQNTPRPTRPGPGFPLSTQEKQLFVESAARGVRFYSLREVLVKVLKYTRNLKG